MRAAKTESVQLTEAPDAVFQAALGVVQNNKKSQVLAVHTGGRKLVVREKALMSNPKFQYVWVDDSDGSTQLRIAVGSDPRSSGALMDGKANEKSLKAFVEGVRGALSGSAPAPASPVADHYLQKKTEVPWTDPEQDPDIELDGNFKAMFAL